MTSIKTQLETKVQALRNERQKEKIQNRIQAAKELQETYNKPVTGRGALLLENIGKLLQTSASEGYGKCISPGDAAKVFLKDFNYWVETYQEPIKYMSDDSILIYIESAFYEITQRDIKVAAPQMGCNAGCPVQLTSGSFRKEVLEGMLKTFRRLDPTFDEISRTILGK